MNNQERLPRSQEEPRQTTKKSLNEDNQTLKQDEGEYLPLGWKMKSEANETYEWVKDSSRTLPHFLNEENIAKTMKSSATISTPFKITTISSNGSSITIEFNTGGYFAICLILVLQWIEMMDGKQVQPCQLAGSQVEVRVTQVDP